jgi:type VI secretion system protein ImpA
MSGDLQQPPVIDLDALLLPISDESPSGESLRYSGLYDEIAEARRADKDVSQGEWQTQLKTADYRKVIDLAIPALTSQTKDLQIAAWLSEALSWQHGFAGVRDSFRLLSGLQENFWETLHPEIDEGDMEGRANAISWMDEQTAFALRKAPITAGPGCGLADFEDSKIFNIPESLDALPEEEFERFSALKTQAEKERRCTADTWRKAKAATRRAFVEGVVYTLEECVAGFAELNRVIDEKFDRNQTPGMPNLKKALDALQTQVGKLLEEKRLEEPDESELAEGADGSAEAVGSGGGAAGTISGRREALRRLAEIAAFFQRTEPHSPVSYLVQRAVSWGNMPLENWLQDVIKDENVLHQLRQTLGLETSGGGGGEAYYSDETPATETSADASSDTW